jgi:hypothetical protein
MKYVSISVCLYNRAQEKAKSLGVLKNSIEGGDGNVAGFLGEYVARSILGGTLSNTYDYDLITPAGHLIDVKTKRTNYTPDQDYECSISDHNPHQMCDYYAFVRVHNNMKCAWFLGVYPRKKYFEDSIFLTEGCYCEDNDFTVKSNCHNLSIKDLYEKVD